ncbi:AMP-binding protein [Flavobacterium zhairuonense]|uniref:AMP-binding protein n=1 Tax=Flavobacterium zhairuonense TaxID=2493631 RepID=UPI0013C2D5E9|nr:AMP-binding protein [Flavobacterium zhairuonense]KAF2506936.1 AMP-binding protein [Flavobacterium zhairuonense]
MDANNGPQIALTDKERFPLLDDLSFLNELRQDAFAPKFNFKSGDRLNAEQLLRVKAYQKNYYENKVFWNEGQTPIWLADYFKWSIETVPFYQNKGNDFDVFPTTSREDIRKFPYLFVSNEANLEELLVYHTSGSTGSKLDVLFDSVSQASWLPQVQSVLKEFNISISESNSKTAIALICAQETTLTYASLSTYLEGAGILKINLNPSDWNHPDDAKKYLEKYNPEILTGDPIAFTALLDLKPQIYPKALISSAMKLTKGAKSKLEDYFKCPVIDLYSMTECRNIAFATEIGHKVIRPDLYLEIFDEHSDTKLPDGERGELVVTGGSNPFLPLIRYRTGDFCSLKIENGIPFLIDLEARNPVVFVTKSDLKINNIDISNRLSELPLAGFKMHQRKDKSIEFVGYSNEITSKEIVDALNSIFKNDIEIDAEIQKIAQNNAVEKTKYSSDLVFI